MKKVKRSKNVEIKRLSKYSEIKIIPITDCENLKFDKHKIIQVIMPTPADPQFALIEVIPHDKITLYESTSDTTQEKEIKKQDKTLEEYRKVVLNTDPFGGTFSGKTLGFIADNSPEWVDHALNNMKNDYIRDRLQYIKDNS